MGLGDLIQAAKGAPAEAPAEELALGVEEPAEKPTPAAAAKSEDLGVEADESGKPQAIPYARFAEVNGKKKAAEERAAKLESDLAAAKKGDERTAAFEKLYGTFEKPLEQMREDAEFAQAVWQLREDPDVRKALAKIQQHHQGAMKAVTERTETPAEKPTPASDPRVEVLYQERVRDTARSVLSDAKVREQLHGPILDYVLKQNPNPSREAVLTTVREYVNAQGWTAQFLRGDGSKPKPAIVPNPGGLNAGTQSAKTPAQAEKPKTLEGLESQRRNRLKEMMQQKGLA